MITTNLMVESENKIISERKGCFSILEYTKDISVNHSTAQTAFFAANMNVHKRQVIADLNGNSVTLQAGAMQMMLGNINATSDVKGVGDLFKKSFAAKATGETAVKPKYSGTGQLVLEPTYKHIILQDLEEWNGGMVVDDGLFLACDSTVEMKVVARTNLSSALAGGEGLFNTCFTGSGIVVLESVVPYDELIIIDVDNDCVKIDGNMAIAWSNTLQFTVEKVTKSIMGSVASGEGLVNVYKGTGKILVAPVG